MMKKLNVLSKLCLCIAIFSSLKLSAAYTSPNEPQVRIDGSGNKIAVWESYNTVSALYEVRYSTNSGAGWSSPNTISDTTLGSFTPKLAINAAGDGAAIWTVRDTGTQTDSLSGAIYHLGSWTTAQPLSPTGDDVISSDVRISDDGDIVVIWCEIPAMSTDNEIFSATATASGGTWNVVGPLTP